MQQSMLLVTSVEDPRALQSVKKALRNLSVSHVLLENDRGQHNIL